MTAGAVTFAESEEAYPLIVLPACRVMSLAAARFLQRLFEGGGRILALGELPAECDSDCGDELGRIIEEVFGPAGTNGERRHESAAGGIAAFHPRLDDDLQLWLLQSVPQLICPDVIIDDADRQPVEDIICCHRTDGPRHYYLLVNRTQAPIRGTVRVQTEGLLQEWLLETGRVRNLFGVTEDEGRQCVEVELEAAAARLLVVTSGQALPEDLTPPPPAEVIEEIGLEPHWEFSVGDENVLILDRWEFTARDRAAGERARVVVPGQVNTYRTSFEVVSLPEVLNLVLDDVAQTIPSHVGFLGRRRSVEIYVNGRQVPPLQPATWQDHYFTQVDIAPDLIAGTNTVELAMTSLLEPFPQLDFPAYLVGRFAVLDNALVAPLGRVHGPFSEQGYPHFVGIARHTQHVTIPERYATRHRLLLDPGEVHDCCRIVVNGEEVAVRLWPAYEVDIAGAVRAGDNEVTVEVANSLANLYEKECRTAGLIGPACIRVCRA